MGMFLGILAAAAIYGLTAWWIIRGWGGASLKADLNAAAMKWLAALFAAMLAGQLVLQANQDAAEVLYWTFYPTIILLGALLSGRGSCSSGRPFCRGLLAAWVPALVPVPS